MFLKGMILFVAVCLSAGCGSWAPIVVGTGITGIHYYHNGKIQEVYKVPMEKAYEEAIRTMIALGLKVIDIKMGEDRRIITAQDLTSKCRASIDLEHARDGMYIKATFKATRHMVLPDTLYGKMIMKEFNDKLVEV